MVAIGVALIGGGIFAKEEHLPAILASPLLSLKAIYSRTLKSAQETASLITDPSVAKPDLYSSDSGEGKSYADILERHDVSGLILALPIMAQPAHVEAALAAGKHVLSEKPIAPDVGMARKLIAYYRQGLTGEKNQATWSVAENFRFSPRLRYAAEQLKTMGNIQTFTSSIFFMLEPGNKWIETPWRKKPEYQGGFLLDGGVHFAAALRMLLGSDHAPDKLVAYSSLVQPHLPPIDTVNAVVKTRSGAVGSFLLAVGTQLAAEEYSVACDKGVVLVGRDEVAVTRLDPEGKKRRPETKDFERSSGVESEVRAWAEALSSGTPEPLQSPEEALADLELMEKMFRSGEEDGSSQTLHFQ